MFHVASARQEKAEQATISLLPPYPYPLSGDGTVLLQDNSTEYDKYLTSWASVGQRPMTRLDLMKPNTAERTGRYLHTGNHCWNAYAFEGMTVQKHAAT